MDKIKICIPISEHENRLLSDEKYYRECWTKNYEKTLATLSINDYNILVQLCFGNEDDFAWIDVSLSQKKDGVYNKIVFVGNVLYGVDAIVIEHETLTVIVEIIKSEY